MTDPVGGRRVNRDNVTGPAITGPTVRVAYCIDNMDVGGTELNAARTAPHLLAAGIELSVFSLSADGPLLQRYAELGVPVETLPLKNLYGRTALACGHRMLAVIRHRAIQVVHAHDFYSNIFAAPWARIGGAAFLASRRWWEGPDRRSQRWANRLAYAFAHRVLANSESVGRLLVREEHLSAEKVVVVPNFLDEDAFEPPPPGWRESLKGELGLPADCVVVGVVASLSAIKNHAMLLQAFAGLSPEWPTLRIVLVGRDGGSRAALEQLAGHLGIADRVHFAGFRPSHPSPHHLFDISVLTSQSEGFPNSILEAMAAARPVVATRVGAVPDAIVDGENGFLVPSGHIQLLQARLHQLLGDTAMARRFGDRGRERARREFSAAAAIGRLVETYHGLAIPGRSRREG